MAAEALAEATYSETLIVVFVSFRNPSYVKASFDAGLSMFEFPDEHLFGSRGWAYLLDKLQNLRLGLRLDHFRKKLQD